MKIFITVIAVLILLLTIIDKLRVRFGYKRNQANFPTKWIYLLVLFCLVMLGFTGHQYYVTKDNGALSKMLIPIVLLIMVMDQWRRRKS